MAPDNDMSLMDFCQMLQRINSAECRECSGVGTRDMDGLGNPKNETCERRVCVGEANRP